jgi:hypothetical protein
MGRAGRPHVTNRMHAMRGTRRRRPQGRAPTRRVGGRETLNPFPAPPLLQTKKDLPWPTACGATGTIRFKPEISHGANAGALAGGRNTRQGRHLAGARRWHRTGSARCTPPTACTRHAGPC